MGKTGKRDAAAIPSRRATARRSVSKARKSAKPGVAPPIKRGLGLQASRLPRPRAEGRAGHVTDASAIRFEPKTAEMLRVLAAAYTNF